jgi:lysophospholipase L1-like esterase
MPRRSFVTAAATAALIALAALAAANAAAAAAGPMQPRPPSAAVGWPGPSRPVPPLSVIPPQATIPPLAACERRLERAGRHAAPTLAVVGASFPAGVGPGGAAQSWAVLLAHMLRWNAVVDGVPGAGYARAGLGGQGPVAAELARIGLRALAPSLVIIQAGHDDIGVPARTEQQRVRQAIALVRAQAPHARIALITVFTARNRFGGPHAAAADSTNRAIVAAASAAGHDVIIMDPLTGRWAFARSHRGGLHPSLAGSTWIARRVAGVLRRHGFAPGPAAGTPLVCDSGISPERLRITPALAAAGVVSRQGSAA